jgi:hypothetical protein
LSTGTPERGSAAVDVVIAAAILIFVIIPVFSVIIERYILLNKLQLIRDAVDITNIAAYNAMDVSLLGREKISFDSSEALMTYKELLSRNLRLNGGLAPVAGSIAEGPVKIVSMGFYTDSFPAVCPSGCSIVRPAVHSCISVPVKPSLYRKAILGMAGKDFIELQIHVDSDIPVNN